MTIGNADAMTRFAIRYGGIASSYLPGIMMVLVARGADRQVAQIAYTTIGKRPKRRPQNHVSEATPAQRTAIEPSAPNEIQVGVAMRGRSSAGHRSA